MSCLKNSLNIKIDTQKQNKYIFYFKIDFSKFASDFITILWVVIGFWLALKPNTQEIGTNTQLICLEIEKIYFLEKVIQFILIKNI